VPKAGQNNLAYCGSERSREITGRSRSPSLSYLFLGPAVAHSDPYATIYLYYIVWLPRVVGKSIGQLVNSGEQWPISMHATLKSELAISHKVARNLQIQLSLLNSNQMDGQTCGISIRKRNLFSYNIYKIVDLKKILIIKSLHTERFKI